MESLSQVNCVSIRICSIVKIPGLSKNLTVRKIERDYGWRFLPLSRVHSNSGPPATGGTDSSAFVHAFCSKLQVKNSNP